MTGDLSAWSDAVLLNVAEFLRSTAGDIGASAPGGSSEKETDLLAHLGWFNPPAGLTAEEDELLAAALEAEVWSRRGEAP